MGELLFSLAGGVIGYALKGNGKVQAITQNGALEELIAKRPATYEVLSLDAATARDNVEYTLIGNFILVQNYHSTVHFSLRLNEKDFPALDLSELTAISGLFHRLFISNVAGNGNIVLKVCRGIMLQASDTISLAELAARLGSIDTFDRRGEVLWLDDFENNINKWNQTLGGGSIALSTDQARSGANSAKLTTAATGTDAASLRWIMGYPVLSKFGFEVSFANLSTKGRFQISFVYCTGTKMVVGGLDYYSATGILSLSGGVQIDTLGLYTSATTWNTIKVVIDSAQNKYVRAILNNKEYDISASSLVETALVEAAHLEAIVAIWRDAAAAAVSIYVDDAIITQNEP